MAKVDITEGKLEVRWIGSDKELRVLFALLEVLEQGQQEGLDDAALNRVTDYISERFPAPPF